MKENILNNYFNILKNHRKPSFKSADLESKISQAYQILENCELCHHKCHINRLADETGICRVTDKISISSYFVHIGEESFLVPSFTIFFNSCTFNCQYCQNWDISMMENVCQTRTFSEIELAQIINANRDCKNVNFVGGEPTPYLPFILKTLLNVKNDIPIIWNSNFYMSDSAMNLLDGVIDIYLTDFKYGNNDCALRLSKIPEYFDVVSKNHLRANHNGEMVIRHLVLPNHLECCTYPVLDFIKVNLDQKVIVNLMDQYRPCYKAEYYDEIKSPLEPSEFQKAFDFAKKLELNFIT